jgi:hypothetical protein
VRLVHGLLYFEQLIQVSFRTNCCQRHNSYRHSSFPQAPHPQAFRKDSQECYQFEMLTPIQPNRYTHRHTKRFIPHPTHHINTSADTTTYYFNTGLYFLNLVQTLSHLSCQKIRLSRTNRNSSLTCSIVLKAAPFIQDPNSIHYQYATKRVTNKQHGHNIFLLLRSTTYYPIHGYITNNTPTVK